MEDDSVTDGLLKYYRSVAVRNPCGLRLLALCTGSVRARGSRRTP